MEFTQHDFRLGIFCVSRKISRFIAVYCAISLLLVLSH